MAIALFLIAAITEITASILLIKGKLKPNPHAAIATMSGVMFAGIGLLLALLALSAP